MVWAYNISVLFYFLAIRIASVFNEKARLWLMGRRGVFKELESAFEGSSETAWFHCASLGEFEQGRPVMEKYRVKYPDHKIVVTFFSPSGYEIRKNYELADHICYLPIDSKRNAARFLNIVNPKTVFFVKYEFWLHYIKAIKKRRIPLFLISGVFRKEHVFFKAYGGLFRRSNMPPLRRGCQDAALRLPDIRGSAPAHQRPRGRLVRLPAGFALQSGRI